ncbi:MAG: hypothetical protein KGL48_17355 [Sphingomonadales bacterium]|nr:hypothetical protein [Sphingomonadales bacterium]MDE2567665.1 hypothetical protein [Sphingomonadales bacterium]
MITLPGLNLASLFAHPASLLVAAVVVWRCGSALLRCAADQATSCGCRAARRSDSASPSVRCSRRTLRTWRGALAALCSRWVYSCRWCSRTDAQSLFYFIEQFNQDYPD